MRLNHGIFSSLSMIIGSSSIPGAAIKIRENATYDIKCKQKFITFWQISSTQLQKLPVTFLWQLPNVTCQHHFRSHLGQGFLQSAHFDASKGCSRNLRQQQRQMAHIAVENLWKIETKFLTKLSMWFTWANGLATLCKYPLNRTAAANALDVAETYDTPNWVTVNGELAFRFV